MITKNCYIFNLVFFLKICHFGKKFRLLVNLLYLYIGCYLIEII